MSNFCTIDEQSIDTSKKKKKMIIIVAVVVALLLVGGAIIVYFNFFAGRELDETIEMYEDAMKHQDEEKMLSIIFPKDSVKNSILRECGEECEDDFEQMKEKNIRIKSIRTKEVEDVDMELAEEIEAVLRDEYGMKVRFSEFKILTLVMNYKQDDMEEMLEEEMLAYKVGDKWYISPGILDYIDKSHQASDYQTSKNIILAVETALLNDEIYDMMKPYFGTVISLENDFTYLPKEFQNEFNNKYNLDEYKPKTKYTKNGATGYSFKIEEDGDVIIYISSEQKLDQWQIYPLTDENYYTDEKPEVNEDDVNVQQDVGYNYVQLISDQSPILGYWQSDEAGMYIGYNTSEYKEGFVVYVYTGTKFEIFNAKTGWSIRGDKEQIYFVNENGRTMELTIYDENNIKCVLEHSVNVTEIVGEFVFEKGEIDPDVAGRFVGEWQECFSKEHKFSVSYDGRLSYQYGESKSYDERVEEDGIVRMPTIILYNGHDSIIFIDTYTEIPEYVDTENDIPIKSASLQLCKDEDMMRIHWEVTGASNVNCEYHYKVGSPQEEFWDAMYAYEELASAQTDYKKVSLIYLDDNDMPELILWDKGEMYTYANGETAKIDCQELTYLAGAGVSKFEYVPRTGRFSTHKHPSTHYFIYDGISVKKQYVYICGAYGVDAPCAYTGENIELDYDAFEQGLKNDGFVDMIEPEKYLFVSEAYTNMEGAWDFD